jgi:hypothetical protein
MSKSRPMPGQTMVKTYRRAKDYADDAAKLAREGWQVLNVVSHEDMAEHLLASFISHRAKMQQLVVTYQFSPAQPATQPPQQSISQSQGSQQPEGDIPLKELRFMARMKAMAELGAMPEWSQLTQRQKNEVRRISNRSTLNYLRETIRQMARGVY